MTIGKKESEVESLLYLLVELSALSWEHAWSLKQEVTAMLVGHSQGATAISPLDSWTQESPL